MNRNLAFYVLVIGVFGALLWFVFSQGAHLGSASTAEVIDKAESAQVGVLGTAVSVLRENIQQPLAKLLLQIAAIIVVSRLLAHLFSKIGQPLVIGEIVAGIVLGPSVLGLVWPQASTFLFAPNTLPILQSLSQVGLILFMFIVGLELDLRLLRHRAHAAVVVSHASIILPFFLGVSLAYFLYETLAPTQISFLAFGLFMGIAMSITAFPVLARIIQERGLSQSPLGALAITCAAADDVTAWCLLAAVIAIVNAGTAVSAVFTILLSGLYVIAMLKGVRPLLRRLAAARRPKTFTFIVFAVLFVSAFATEAIGIHALFGAFLAGVSMPDQAGFKKALVGRLEDVSVVILLPLFFAFSGLKTQIGLLNNGSGWLLCGLIFLVAVAGKFGGSFVAARVTGQSWADSLAIGALMNTRGLMELIVLNIGYDLGILSPLVFTMMVLMALLTTFMTSPVLTLIEHNRWKRQSLSVEAAPESS